MLTLRLAHEPQVLAALRRACVDAWDTEGGESAFVAARTTLATVSAVPFSAYTEVNLTPAGALHLLAALPEADRALRPELERALAANHAAEEAALHAKRAAERRDRVPVREARGFGFPC